MTAITGTISTGQDADLYTAMATALTTEGYTLVDTVVISTRTHKVWKNAAANNDWGVDWYLDIGYPTTGQAGISIRPFEDYTVATHLGIRGIFPPATYTPETTYYTRFGATGAALETSWLTSAASLQISTSASAYGYRLSITPERITGMTTVVPAGLIYAGLIDLSNASAAAADTAAFPLVTLAGTAIYQTRYPKASAAISASVISSIFATTANENPFPTGNFSSLASYAWQGTVRGSTSTATGTVPLSIDGYLKDVLLLKVAATVNHGDTFTYDGATWWIAGDLSQRNAWCVRAV